MAIAKKSSKTTSTSIARDRSNLLAAVDLGSNSFRMEIGRIEGRSIVREHYVKDTVRLGAGLDKTQSLTPEAIKKGAAALAEFAKLLKGIPPENIRCVATNTLRVARNPEAFIAAAQPALGCPIEVIPGREEARLIYAGVAHMLPYSESPRLVVDIGGGSTEMIVGRGFDPLDVESFKLGSVSETKHHFADNRLTEATLSTAEIAVAATLEEGRQRFSRSHWSMAYGSSGTAGAIADIARENNWSDGTITRAVLAKLRNILIDAGRPDRVRLAGLKPDRVPVLAGGYSVLAGVFKALDIEELLPAKGSLRHGVLYQLLDRRMGSDAREASITSLARRFAIDFAHADQVKAVAQGLFVQIQPANTTGLDRKLLAWAALTHELGFAVSHGNYHRHSAYIIANSDLNGFAPQEQQWLAELVLAHRGNLQKVADAFGKHEHYVQQIAALRFAAIICHAREPLNARQIKAYNLQQKGKTINLTVAKIVADQSRETIHLLREEVLAWKDAGYRVVVSA